MTDYSWPGADARALLGTRVPRVDGPAKVSGAARYASDVRRPGMLAARVVRCPHAHARLASLDLGPARKVPGVIGALALQDVGAEIQWALDEVAVVAAETDEAAQDGVRAVIATYDVLPHFVTERELDAAPAKDVGEEEVHGLPDGAFASAAFKVSGRHGLPSVAHCCLEPHGTACEWDADGNLTAWMSTQAVSAMPGQLAEALDVPAAKVRVLAPYVGGGFGSKFGPDRWGVACAKLARDLKRPVRLFLDRAAELAVAGDRPSCWADVSVCCDANLKLTGWESTSWGTGGVPGSGAPPLPYVFDIPHRRQKHVSASTNRAGARAWRAPNHPQACLITMAAIDDLAAAAKVSPLELVTKNLDLAPEPRRGAWASQLALAADLSGWTSGWKPRGTATGVVRRGMGLSLHTWGGRGHRSNVEVRLQPDGSVEARVGSQDIGTGTRTVIATVVADTLGLPVSAVHVSLGDSSLPQSSPSGGSTTVGGVSAAARRAAVEVRDALFTKAAPSLGVAAGELECRDASVRVKATPSKTMSWKAAVALAGPTPLAATGANPGPQDLTASGVAGVQVASVSVDTETGVVRVEKMVAVQDCGFVVDLQTAESQVRGALVMGLSYALMEEKVHDATTGRLLNADMEHYKLPGIADVGELVVRIVQDASNDARGVIGLGEPPVISPGAALSNAVANAIGVRVPELPLTPDRVLAALGKA